MGSSTHVREQITIVPPLNGTELRRIPGLLDYDEGDRQAYVLVKETTEESGEDTIIRRKGVAIVADEGERSFYELTEQVQEIVNAFPERRYEGYLTCDSDNGELWRVAVVDGQATEIYPDLIWPGAPLPDELTELASIAKGIVGRLRKVAGAQTGAPDDRIDVIITETAERLAEMSNTLEALAAFLNRRQP